MEYINLKRAAGSKEDVNTSLVSLRAQYSNIRTKVSKLWLAALGQILLFACTLMFFLLRLQYDALLKKRNQTDLDIAPLKVKKKKKKIQ